LLALVDGEVDGAVFFLPDETARSRRESGPWIAGLDLLGR
jgi:hypothetical protein